MLMPDFSEILSDGGVNMVAWITPLDNAATRAAGPPSPTDRNVTSFAASMPLSRSSLTTRA